MPNSVCKPDLKCQARLKIIVRSKTVYSTGVSTTKNKRKFYNIELENFQVILCVCKQGAHPSKTCTRLVAGSAVHARPPMQLLSAGQAGPVVPRVVIFEESAPGVSLLSKEQVSYRQRILTTFFCQAKYHYLSLGASQYITSSPSREALLMGKAQYG